MKQVLLFLSLVGFVSVSLRAQTRPLVIAHRGASAEAPENTVASARLAWEQEAEAVEVDVYLSKDKKIVVIHDNNTRRTGGENKLVSQTTYKELAKLDVGSWKDAKYQGEKIPLLADIIQTIPRKKRLFVEVKCGKEIVPRLKKLLRNHPKRDQIDIISFKKEVLVEVRKSLPDLNTYWVLGGTSLERMKEVIREAEDVGITGLDVHHSLLSPPYVKLYQEAKLPIYVWTVNSTLRTRDIANLGLRGITTDRPAVIRATMEGRLLRLMTFNIYHGATMKGDFDLDTIAEVIRKYKPDLVALQEVDFLTHRAKGMDLVLELAYRTKMQGIFGRAMKFDGGEYGEGVLSRYSFVGSRNIPLPSPKGKEPRSALEVLVELSSGDTVRFIGTHLDHTKPPEARTMQVKKLTTIGNQGNYPTILAGDLNATPETSEMKTLFQQWIPSSSDMSPTFSSKEPTRKIDYILLHKNYKWQILYSKVICDTVATDHCVYFTEIILKK